MNTTLLHLWLAIFCLSMVFSAPSIAQQRPSNTPKQLAAELSELGAGDTWGALFLTATAQMIDAEVKRQKFWDAPRGALAAATAQLVVEPNPFTRALMRMRGKELAVWHERRDDLDSAPELNADWLLAVRDGTTMPDFRGKAPDLRRKSDLAVYDAYCQAVLFAKITPLQAFEKSEDDQKHVTFGHLWHEFDRVKQQYKEKHFDEPNKYRGKVIRVEGELLRLRKYPAPTKLLDQGIPFVYEGWIKGPTPNAYPYCVIFPDPPQDSSSKTGVLEPTEELHRPVTFYGYFFKMFRYPVQVGAGSNVRTEDHDSPMLIGPTLIVQGATPPQTDPPLPMSRQLMYALVGFGAFVIALLVGLSIWFRKGDRQFRAQVEKLHTARAMEMFDAEEKPDEKS